MGGRLSDSKVLLLPPNSWTRKFCPKMQRIFHPSRPSEEDKANSGEILSLFKCYCVNSIWLNKRSVGGIKRIRTSKPLNLVMFWLSTLSSIEFTKNFICQTAMLTRMLYIHEFSFNTILMMTMQSIWRSPLAFPVALTN